MGNGKDATSSSRPYYYRGLTCKAALLYELVPLEFGPTQPKEADFMTLRKQKWSKISQVATTGPLGTPNHQSK